ncbi:ComEC/Rec2 family competence protein [Elizabethkingia miricola]|uniref:ComEC/Rec2 family competence protein n=1 Tax=Elizabethkingia miricola TaxID=172045 RepID=UPI0038929C31
MKIKLLNAGNGDSFLLSFNDKGIKRNILIDGGTAETYYSQSSNSEGELKTEIESLKKKGECIDLLILTHIDNDHICGLLKWFELDPNAHELIRNVWFNSGKIIANYLKEQENEDLMIGLKVFPNSRTGVNEAIEFEDYLSEKKIWNKKIYLQGQKIKEFGIEIHILSPNEGQLKKLLKEYKKTIGDQVFTSAKEKDWDKNICEFIEEEEKEDFKFNQDYSPKNGSSISFILIANNEKYLFLADSPPNDIVKQIAELGYSNEQPLDVKFMKVSHHGSKLNTSKSLLQIVKTNEYLISTDSLRHNHPNKRTLARILNENPNATFHFNYEHVRNAIFSDKDRKDYPFKAKVTKELEY